MVDVLPMWQDEGKLQVGCLMMDICMINPVVYSKTVQRAARQVDICLQYYEGRATLARRL